MKRIEKYKKYIKKLSKVPKLKQDKHTSRVFTEDRSLVNDYIFPQQLEQWHIEIKKEWME